MSSSTRVVSCGLLASTAASIAVLLWMRKQGQEANKVTAELEREEKLRAIRERLAKSKKQNKKQKKANGKDRHVLVKHALQPEYLQRLFPDIKRAFKPQPIDYTKKVGYSRYRNWKISCYLRAWPQWTPRIAPHMPLVDVLDPILDDCVAQFKVWYNDLWGLRESEVIIMNSFVTRYRTEEGETQLKKHVDGRHVDGSVILALPTDCPFEGGKLTVWEKRKGTLNEFEYAMKPGDMIFLDNMIWHQAHPITSGERWALVLFLKCKWKKGNF